MPEPQVTNIRKIVINKMTQEQYDSMTKNADELYLTPDTDSLPSQTGNSGKYLTTNGTTTSWASVPAGTVTSVRVQATSPVQSSTSSAQSTSLNTTISLANGYGDTKNPYASKTANTVLAAPNGSDGVPTFRALEKTDIPLASETAESGGTTTSLVTTGEKYTWNNKQDAISDLATIRSGASAGATAVQPEDLATVATSGSYNDLTNKPTIPAAQVNSDWNATSGVAQILNKPTIPTVGDAEIEIQKNGTKVDSFTTNQSGNKKTINITVPTNNNQLTNGAGYITSSDIPTNVSAFTNDAGYLTSHQNIKNLNTNNTTGQTASDSENIAGSGTINLHKVSKTGSYNDLLNKPTIPTVNNATLTIQKNGTTVNTFTANSSTNVTANITVPTKTSDITNDSGFITSTDIPTKLSDFTDDLGSSPTHTHSQYLTSHQTIKTLKTDNTTGQTTSSGEALTGSGTINLHKVAKTGSYNDLLNKPTIPVITDTYSSTSSDGMSGKAVASAISNKADKATTLSGYGITDAYTKTEIDGMVSAVMHFKGTVASYSNLPATGNKTGDMYNVTDTGANYAWDGTAWDKLSENVDLSGYVPTSRTINSKALTGNITLTASDVGAISSHQSIKTLKTDNTTTQSTSSSEAIAGSGTINLHKISKTGNYNDLLNKPSIPSTASDVGAVEANTAITGATKCKITYDSKGLVTAGADLEASDIPDLSSTYLTSHQSIKTLKTDNTTAQSTSSSETITGSGTINLHKVAKTGSYNDLNNKPTIPATNVIPATTTANKVLVSTTTSGTAKWSDFSTAGLLKTNTSGVISVDTTSYGTYSKPSGGIPASDLAESYYLASNPNGYTTNTGTVTGVTAGTGLNTTSNDSSTDGGTISSSGTIYLTKSGVTAGTYQGITIDKYGRVTGATDKGYTTNTGTVTSVRVQAGTGLSSSTSTAQSQTLNTTISIASGYKLPTTTEWSNKQNALPSQSGNSGKYLTTNGSALSWASVDALPSQSGQSGKFLTTNGTSASWEAPVTWTYNAATKTMEVD